MERRVLEKRKHGTKQAKKTVRIYCNGEQTERLYFESLLADLGIPPSAVCVIPKKHNRLSLVREIARSLKREAADVDEIWVVFDVDSKPKGRESNPAKVKEQANEACVLCKKKGYFPIVSNECFELWFYLHYNAEPSDLHRDLLAQKLSDLIGEKYDKDTEMYERISSNLVNALERSKKLCDSYAEYIPVANRLPYTNVHTLVEAMYKRAQKNLPVKKNHK